MTKPFYKRIWFIVLIILTLSFGGVVFYLSQHFSNIIENNLRSTLTANPNRKYNVDFEKLKLEVLAGNIAIQGIEISPNWSILDSLNEEGIHQSILAKLEVHKINLNNIDLQKLVYEQQLSLEKILIINPIIKIDFTGYQKKVKDTITSIEAFRQIAEEIHDLSVRSIEIKNATVGIRNLSKDSSDVVTLKNVSLKLDDFQMDTTKELIPINLSQAELKIGAVELKLAPNHNVLLKKLVASFDDSSLTIGSTEITPTKNKEEFSANLDYQKTWIKIETGTIKISGIELIDFLFKEELTINHIDINGLILNAYKDKSPKWPSHLKHEIPSQLLKKIPFDLMINQISINQSEIHFEQKQPGHKNLGKFNLTHIDIIVSNITNIPRFIEEDHSLSSVGTMRMMGKGKMNTNLTFDLRPNSNNWSLYANVGRMNFAELNPIIFPLTNVKIEAGKLIEADIKMNCNKYMARGTLDLQYRNAEMKIMRVNKESQKLEDKGMLSFVANSVIRSENIKNTEHYKQGDISYTRTADEPFIKFLWNSVQSGMIDTFIGFHKKENQSGKGSIFNIKLRKNKKR